METAIDYEHLAQYTGGDAALEAEIFLLFQNQIESWLRVLEPDSADEDWAAASHSLKGSAKGVGANHLAEVCARAEKLVGEAGDPAAREVARNRILDAVNTVNDEIARQDYRRTVSDLRSAS